MSQPRERILILDDEPGMCRLLTAVLGDAGFRVTAFGDPQAALAAFERQPFDLVISDVSMPRVGGLDVLRRVKAKDPDAAVILITAYGTTKSAVEAIKLGTNDFIPKPFRNEEMRLAVEAVLERRRLARENASLRRELSARAGFGRLAGLGPAMRDACAALAEAAEKTAPVTLVGEPGSGKELAARELHDRGGRASAPFVVARTAQDAEALLCMPARERLEALAGGTLLLRDFDLLPAAPQASLARLLTDGKLKLKGGLDWHSLDARIVLATAREAEEWAAGGKVRPDLARRAAATVIRLPPLRERPEDLPLLVDEFARRAARRRGAGDPMVLPETMDLLRARRWPGNLPELESAVERAVAAARGAPLHPSHFGAGVPSEEDIRPFREEKQAVVDEFERRYLRGLISACAGNLTRAAALADMDRKNLYELLKKHGLPARQD